MTRWARGAAFPILAAIAAACGLLGETVTHETVRGRLKFVQDATATGTYGSEKSYSISNGDFRFQGRHQWGLGTFVVCIPSPNEAREAFVCSRHQDMRERIDLVSVVSDQAGAVNVYEGDLRDDIGLPSWVGDPEGAWLIVTDFLYNAETGEERTIKGAPGRYDAHFRAVSPDVETVVYQLGCMGGMAESEAEKRIEALCAEAEPRRLEVLWLVEARTGAVEVRTLRRSDHEWLTDGGRVPGGDAWLASFRRHLVWERDPKGRFRLAAPPAEPQ